VNVPVAPVAPPAPAPVAPPVVNVPVAPVGPPIEVLPPGSDPALDPDWQPSLAEVAEAQQLFAESVALGDGLVRGFYRWGIVLRELGRPRRYRALGHRTFEELLEEHPIPLGRTKARRLIAIAARLDEASARALGVDKAYEVIRYSEAIAPGRDPRRLLEEDPRVKGLTVRVSEASANELSFATSLILRGEATPTLTDTEARLTRGSARRLRARLGKLDLGEVDVRVHRSRKRLQVWVKLEREEADALLRLLPSTVPA
jgi:hypothetical protein